MVVEYTLFYNYRNVHQMSLMLKTSTQKILAADLFDRKEICNIRGCDCLTHMTYF
jgi:hypothetical protein